MRSTTFIRCFSKLRRIRRATRMPCGGTINTMVIREEVRGGEAAGGTTTPTKPVLVVLGGLAQTADSFTGHHRALAKGRPCVIQYEARGQGCTQLATDDCSLERHAGDFADLLAALGQHGGDGDDGDDGDDDGDSENEKAETSMLHARLVAAKKALAPPSVSLDSIKTTSLEHLSKPTLTVEIVGSDRSRHDIHVSNDDTSAGLKLRYASSTSWVSGQDEVLVRNGVELLDARELVQGDVLFIVRRRHHGRCGPVTSCEGRCSLCQKKSTFFSYGAETVQGSMRWLQGVVEYRQWMHRPVSEMREEMMVQAGRGQVEEEDGRRWTPWVGVWDAMKVKNMRAAVMLAEGQMDEYEKESRRYVHQCYAKRGGSRRGSGRLQKEPRAPPVPVVKATNLLLAPPPPPPPLATSMN